MDRMFVVRTLWFGVLGFVFWGRFWSFRFYVQQNRKTKTQKKKKIMIEVEKIIQREKDRKASRKDRKSVGGKKIAFASVRTHHSNDDT